MVARSRLGKWFLVSTGWIMLIWVSSGSGSLAQVIPDQNLPVGERSQISGNPNFQIDGGATRGENLFHSFSAFSIPTGGSAFFNNAATIQNIFSRITGGEISNIDGLIRANGTANLFVINPNGILFGPNARLDIGGSFMASTASSINFADGTLFSANAPQTAPLLTISVPIGLQMGQNPGNIRVQGTGYGSASSPFGSPIIIRGSGTTGLRVVSGKTLALVGGDVGLEGGTLAAEQGRIELGSVRDGQVSLSSTPSGLALSYQSQQRFGDIRLSQQALADASGVPGGSIQVQGNQVSLANGSLLLIQNQGGQGAGSIRINAAQSVELNGGNVEGTINVGLLSETLSGGRGADIAISSPQFIVRDGAFLYTFSYGSGQAGDVTASTSDAVQVTGFSSPLENSAIASVAYSSGNTGNITVSTGRLTLLNGGVIAAQVIDTGQAGDVTVNATESVEVIGKGPAVASNVDTATGGAGDAGKLTINTSRLVVRDGGLVTTLTQGIGDAGSLTINASESVEVSGIGSDFSIPSFVGASGFFVPDTYRQRYPIPLGVPLVSSGNAGDVTITTERLSVTDDALIDVSNAGTGNAGTLTIKAGSIFLDRGGTITAATASGEGGNINLQVRDVLLMRRNGGITSTAGGTGNGGNISIDTSSLVAVPTEDNDISADSVNARGGNVIINADGLFGSQLSLQDTEDSDITATGANSALSGSVQLNIERADFTNGLVQLPTELVDVSGLIAQGCRDTQGSSFVVTGRGGLPPAPQQALSHDPLWQDWRTPAGVNHQPTATADEPVPPSSNPAFTGSTPSEPLVEATGWVIEPNGKVTLTAEAPNVSLSPPWIQSANCNRL